MPFTDNTARHRFELDVNGKTAFATYRVEDGKLYILHVEAPPELRGTGAAGRLMEAVMNAAQERTLDVVPICGYAAAWIQRHTL